MDSQPSQSGEGEGATMTDFRPYRPRNPSPWPRRIAYIALIALAALALYVFSAQAGGPPPRNTIKQWPPKPPSTYYCQRAAPRPPSYCFTNSRRPYRP